MPKRIDPTFMLQFSQELCHFGVQTTKKGGSSGAKYLKRIWKLIAKHHKLHRTDYPYRTAPVKITPDTNEERIMQK